MNDQQTLFTRYLQTSSSLENQMIMVKNVQPAEEMDVKLGMRFIHDIYGINCRAKLATCGGF